MLDSLMIIIIIFILIIIIFILIIIIFILIIIIFILIIISLLITSHLYNILVGQTVRRIRLQLVLGQLDDVFQVEDLEMRP